MKDNTLDIIHNTSRQPKLSVIIPLYNKAPYIRKALESVFAQTFKDWELIVVDDGSTDGSATICEKFIKEASQTIHNTLYIIHQTNSGVSAARNNGVAASHGEFVCFLDADDWWEPTYLEKMAQLIEDYPEAGLYASNYVYYKPGKTRVAVNNIETGYFNYPKAYYEGGAMPVTSISVAVPRKVFEEVGGFPLGIKLGEDFLLWSKIAMQYKVAFLNEALAWYNNDVPATLRATRNLHAPEHHMLFNLEAYLQLLPEGKRDGASLKSSKPSPFLKEGEHASFAKTWGAHTADSTQYDLLKENAKANRKNPTEAESVMWDMLKGNNIGYHFRRQHIILDYIVDFICLEKGLVIELDGGYHNNLEQKEYDERRTAHLQRLGYTELRFKNEELLCNPDSVIQKITETLEQLPSLQGGVGGRLSTLPFREGQGVGSEWRLLIDKLRVNGLLDYWLDKRYHDLAAEELKKVDWSKQPASVIRIYKTPIWILKAKRYVMSVGSFIKQQMIRLKVKGERLRVRGERLKVKGER